MDNVYNALKIEVKFITNDLIRSITARVLQEVVPDWYLDQPVSNSEFYRNSINNKLITIIERNKSAVRLFCLYYQNPLVSNAIQMIDRDLIIAALIIHDLNLYGLTDEPYSSADRLGHITNISKLRPSGLSPIENDLFDKISELIASHHGPYRIGNSPEVSTNAQFYVHICDYLAASPTILVNTSDDYELVKRFR